MMPVLMWHARACRKPSTSYGCQSTNKTVDSQFLYPALNFILLASMETQNDHVFHSSTIFWLTHSVAPHRPRGSVLRALIPPSLRNHWPSGFTPRHLVHFSYTLSCCQAATRTRPTHERGISVICTSRAKTSTRC